MIFTSKQSRAETRRIDSALSMILLIPAQAAISQPSGESSCQKENIGRKLHR
jgi:hypothetical protein